MSQDLYHDKNYSLDDVLVHFGYKRRDANAPHEAIKDCELTAKIYMDLMKLPERKTSDLGFVKDKPADK